MNHNSLRRRLRRLGDEINELGQEIGNDAPGEWFARSLALVNDGARLVRWSEEMGDDDQEGEA